MRKPLIKFEQLPDPLSRYRCVLSQHTATMPEGHEELDVYPLFYDPRYRIEIKMVDGRVFKNFRE